MKIKYRKSRRIELPPRILILCEGESEMKYLKGFQTEEKNRRRLSSVKIELYQPDNYSPCGLLNEAKRRAKEAAREGYGFRDVWIVFDRDGHSGIPRAFDEAYAAGINIAFSLICFEYWILLHFERTNRYFPNCDALIHHIEHRKYIVDYNKTNFYASIKDHQDLAISNADWLWRQNELDLSRGLKEYDLPAYTSFHRLFISLKELLG